MTGPEFESITMKFIVWGEAECDKFAESQYKVVSQKYVTV